MQGASELTSVQVDVVIIGGGVQGLVILNELTERRYTCALVTDEDLGGGQTLHSHGFLNTGFGMAGNELPAGAVGIVQPYLLSKGVPVQENWIVLAAPGFPALAGLPPVNLPPGFAPAFAEAARKLPDRSLDKQQLVEVLARDRMDRVIRGTVAGFRGRNPVEAVVVQPQGSAEMLELQARAVVVAAGCGSKKLLAGLAGAAPQLDAIKHRLVHMVCVRAPRGALPAVSVAALPLGLLVAAHEDADWVTWYVTPMEFGGPSFDDVPTDASAGTLPAMLARAAAAVLKLYPSLPDTLGLRVGHYAGYRQDIGDMPGVRMCQVAAGTGNVVAALPSGLIGPWLNAADALALLDGLIGPATCTGDCGNHFPSFRHAVCDRLLSSGRLRCSPLGMRSDLEDREGRLCPGRTKHQHAARGLNRATVFLQCLPTVPDRDPAPEGPIGGILHEESLHHRAGQILVPRLIGRH